MQSGSQEKCFDGSADPKSGSQLIGANVCADFSSKGPTTDMRIKPDVVAPGVSVLSALSRAVKENNAILADDIHGECPDKRLVWMTGTSHSAPLVTGFAAVLREAVKAKGTAAPSGALIKSLIVNGAIDLAGSQCLYCTKTPKDTSNI